MSIRTSASVQIMHIRKKYHCADVRTSFKGTTWGGMQPPQHIALCILRETWQCFLLFPADKLYWSQATEKKQHLPECGTCNLSVIQWNAKEPISSLRIDYLSVPPVQKAHPTANCRLTCRRTERNDCACNNNRRDHYYSGHFDVLVELLGSPGNTNRHMPGMCVVF